MSVKRFSSRPFPQLPTKWVAAILCGLIGSALLQPVLHLQLGWRFPLLLDQHRATRQETDKAGGNVLKLPVERSRNEPIAATAQPPGTSTQMEQGLLYGVLTETAPADYLSPAGLGYTRGSEEGHRLKHLERHLQDDPSRPGKHGVFRGDMPQVLRWLDEAFVLAREGAKGTSIRHEDGRTVYEASFSMPVGFIGGREGGRAGNPDARRIRLVVEDDDVITAFPF